MAVKYYVTCTGETDLYLVYTRTTDDAPATFYCPATTYDRAMAIAGKLNLENALRACADIMNNGDLTTDTDLADLDDAVTALQHIVHWDMNGYRAKRRFQDAKDLAAGIVELEATA